MSYQFVRIIIKVQIAQFRTLSGILVRKDNSHISILCNASGLVHLPIFQVRGDLDR